MCCCAILVDIEVGHTDKGRQHPSKRDPIFLRGTEANLKMVRIYWVPVSRNRAVGSGGTRGALKPFRRRFVLQNLTIFVMALWCGLEASTCYALK